MHGDPQRQPCRPARTSRAPGHTISPDRSTARSRSFTAARCTGSPCPDRRWRSGSPRRCGPSAALRDAARYRSSPTGSPSPSTGMIVLPRWLATMQKETLRLLDGPQDPRRMPSVRSRDHGCGLTQGQGVGAGGSPSISPVLASMTMRLDPTPGQPLRMRTQTTGCPGFGANWRR
jgi:hypothetical protein